jgi:hypothetical protein
MGAFILAMAIPALAAPAPAPEKGMVQINYHRCDGKYANWGVHLWQDPNMPLPDIEWPNPMKPTGTSDFGVYWNVKEDEFGGKIHVNYIIHRGDIKEQGGKDMSFDGRAHKAIWVNTNDRAIYYSLEDAKKDHVCAAAK